MKESGFDGQDDDVGYRCWLHRMILPVCRAFALVGGAIMILLINISLVSIIGRKLLSSPVRGDVELMEMGSAVAIAAFLPLCEIRGLHIKADAFTMWAPAWLNRWLDAVAHALLVLAAAFLAWRTGLQVMAYREYGDMSTLLSVPMWIPLALVVPSLCLLALSGLARMFDCIEDGRRQMPWSR